MRASPQAAASNVWRCGWPRSARSTANVGSTWTRRRPRGVRARCMLAVYWMSCDPRGSGSRNPTSRMVCPSTRTVPVTASYWRASRTAPSRAPYPQRDASARPASTESTTDPMRKPRGRSPLRHSTRRCAMANVPSGPDVQRRNVHDTSGGSVGCSAGGSRTSRAAPGISYVTCSTHTPGSTSGSVSRRSITGACAASASTSAVPESTSAPRPKLRHDLGREEAQAREDLLLRDRLHGVHDEVERVDADRLPSLDGLDDARGVADGDAVGDASRSAGAARLGARRGREGAERLVGARRVRLAGRKEVRVEEREEAEHAHARRRRLPGVVLAIEEVQRRDPVVDDAGHRIALANPAVVLARAALLLRVARSGDAERADAPFRRVELGSRARDRHP